MPVVRAMALPVISIENPEISGLALISAIKMMFVKLKNDDSVKSRHSGENRSPDQLEPFDITGFRLSPE